MGLTDAERKVLALHEARVELSHHLIRNTISLEETANLVLEPVMRLTGASAGFVSYIDPGTRENVGFVHVPNLAACAENMERTALRFPIRPDGTYAALWGVALNTRKGFFTNAPLSHPEAKGVPAGHVALDNFLSVPVAIGKRLLGQVALANKAGGFSDDDLRVATLFGELYGLALDRKFAEQEILDAERKATKRLDRRFKAFMDATPDRLHIVGSDGVILESHMGKLPFVANDPKEYIGKNLHDLFPGGDTAERMLEKVREALAADGKPVVWEYAIPQIPDHIFEGHLIKCGPDEVMVVVREATQAKQMQIDLERKVRERTRDLEMSNQALQSFAYAASHDIREPLNKIRAYGERFKATHPDLDAKGREYLCVMTTAAERLARLVDDLLEYSKAGGRDDAPLMTVSLDKVVAETLSDLDETVRKSGAVVRVEPLPTVQGHSTQFRHVFQNILSNAMKFHKPGESPKIRVSGRVDDGVAFVSVTDDGIGFDPTYKEKIFAIFSRLHTRFDYPGTGIGLALCRRILAQYGGTVTADARPDEGATFTIQLPLRQQGT